MLFNGVYTVIHGAEHRTFKISTNAPDATFAPGQRIVSLLTGADNEADYTGFGFVTANEIKVWRSKQGTAEKPSFFDKSAKMLEAFGKSDDWTNPYVFRGMSLQLEKRCCKCNRKLTNPESLATGIGPECAKKSGMISLER